MILRSFYHWNLDGKASFLMLCMGILCYSFGLIDRDTYSALVGLGRRITLKPHSP